MLIFALGLGAFVLSFILSGLDKRTEDKISVQPATWSARVIGALMMIGALGWSTVAIVPAGNVGVQLRFGAVKGQLGEGIHTIMPMADTVVLMESRTQKDESEASASSSDLQVVTTRLALNFRIDPNKAGELFANVGIEYKARIIDPAVQEAIKVVTAKYTAEDLIRQRATVKSEVEEEITQRLLAYNIIVEPSGLSITNFDFSPEFNRAIEAKQVAQQEAQKQEYVLQQAELEKDTMIMRAEGEAASATLQAEALKVQGGSMVIAREWIEKWDGKLPTVSAGGDNMIIDISSLMNE